MPRRVLLPTKELGDLDVYVIYEKDGLWEDDWKSLQGGSFSPVVTIVSKEVWDHALYGFTSPFIKKLGLAPMDAARKLPLINQACHRRLTCPMYEWKQCVPTHAKMPCCFEPAGIEDALVREKSTEVIRIWREKAYVVIVQE